MKSAEIRRRFLEFFAEHGHEVVRSSPLVPEDDPTLLFTNAGMVQFKRVFLGLEERHYSRAVTVQKCVRAGGKHNDLEEVGRTTRHHTFFEMLGNFSFGDYFKEEAVRYAWDLMTEVYGLEGERLFATVHHTDDEAYELWRTIAGLPAERIFRLGDEDNFWQMADTGPCGPCSELLYDLRPESERAGALTPEAFVKESDAGRIVELWNLVFMQFDRSEEGEMRPLPAPSIDTGAGLERLAAVLQGVDSNYHTDLFLPLLDRVGEVIGREYDPASEEGVSFRVIADHARAVAFLLADGVFPSNEGRGYVLRRILRRAVRHAWLLGRREPTLVGVVEAVVDRMSEPYPELDERRAFLLRTTRDEEERFLATVEGGMERFDEVAPPREGGEGPSLIPGEEAFRLYDTYGFPLDLTELMAEERGYEVDRAGFEEALARQRERSRADRAAAGTEVERDGSEGWVGVSAGEQTFVGYDRLEVESEVLAVRPEEGRLGLQLRENPFYAEAGGQVSDVGRVSGEGWSLEVEEVVRVGDRIAVLGPVEGEAPEPDALAAEKVRARVDARARRNTARNHTATHLLHAALRSRLGEHVVQRGSLVAPDRLRFDFAHSGPLTEEERRDVEEEVNQAIWSDLPLEIRQMPYDEAIARGAMALFGEKYGDLVRVVEIPEVSVELCGGTHVPRTGTIGLFRILKEGGVAAGVRRVEAVTGPGAFREMERAEEHLEEASALLRATPENLVDRIERLVEERERLEHLVDELRADGGAGEEVVVEAALPLDGRESLYRGIRLTARDAQDARDWGDRFLAGVESGVAVLAAEMPEGKNALFTFVTDDLIGRGVRADELVRRVAALVGGRGGGRPHMAQAGVEDAGRVDEALRAGADEVRALFEAGSSEGKP